MDKNMEIISQLMVTITQTNEWFRICHEDAQIQRATLGLQTVMERVAARPTDLTRYIIDRAKTGAQGGTERNG